MKPYLGVMPNHCTHTNRHSATTQGDAWLAPTTSAGASSLPRWRAFKMSYGRCRLRWSSKPQSQLPRPTDLVPAVSAPPHGNPLLDEPR